MSEKSKFQDYTFVVYWEQDHPFSASELKAKEDYEKSIKQFCIEFDCLPQKQYRIGTNNWDDGLIETITVNPISKTIYIEIEN